MGYVPAGRGQHLYDMSVFLALVVRSLVGSGGAGV